jgi:hypothetical protein
MQQIKLTKGQYALVDDEDYEHLNQWKWWTQHVKSPKLRKQDLYYACRTDKHGKNISMHRQIMGLPELQVDHINRNSLDNRRSNLRLATRQENLQNRSLRADNTSKLIGVYWDKSRNKWHAQIQHNGIAKNLGRFEDKNEAIRARDEAVLKTFGQFAVLNEIGE